jgi:hypothetical protein
VNAQRWIPYFALVVSAALMTVGCRHFPDQPKPVQQPLQGSYVGIGNLNADHSATNVSMAIEGPDSLGHYTGQIGYLSVVTTLDSVVRDSTGDTLIIRYTRNSAIYRPLARVTSSGMTVHFTQPTGIAAFLMNREVNGYNMTGMWVGKIYSNGLGVLRDATMTMDQEGTLFQGTVNVNLFQSAQFNLSSGSYNAGTFQISGTARMAGNDYPVLMAGNFVNVDSLSGNWQLGTNGGDDAGTFYMGRSFR